MTTRPTRRALAFGVTIAAGALALTACGSSSSSSSSSSPSASGTPTVSADAALAAKVPADIKSTGKITFGTDASYAPNEFYDVDGKTIIGFDVDMGKAIAAKLGLQGDFQNSSFDAIVVGVEQGKFNSAMSSITINPEREKQVNMISYFNAGTAWAAAAGNPKNVSPDDACGKIVAVQKATVQVDDIEARSKACTTAGKAAITIQQYNLQSDATTAVTTGKADAMLADSPVVAYAIKQTDGKLQQVGSVSDSAPYGVIVQKSQTEFAQAIQGAINALIADGAYGQIANNWGLSEGEITASEINPAVK